MPRADAMRRVCALMSSSVRFGPSDVSRSTSFMSTSFSATILFPAGTPPVMLLMVFLPCSSSRALAVAEGDQHAHAVANDAALHEDAVDGSGGAAGRSRRSVGEAIGRRRDERLGAAGCPAR